MEASANRHWNGLEKSVRLISPGEKAWQSSPMLLMVCPLSCAPKETVSVVERRLRPKRSQGLSATISWNLFRSQPRMLVRMERVALKQGKSAAKPAPQTGTPAVGDFQDPFLKK